MIPRFWLLCVIGGVLLLDMWGCTGNRFEQRTEMIKEHVSSFYEHLESRQPDQAIFDNRRIEQVALESEEYLLRRVGQLSQSERTQEWKLIKTAKEAAAENWLALARYFTQAHDYKRAQGTFQRMLDTYSDSAFRTYQERAKAGLRDLELLGSPEPKP